MKSSEFSQCILCYVIVNDNKVVYIICTIILIFREFVHYILLTSVVPNNKIARFNRYVCMFYFL